MYAATAWDPDGPGPAGALVVLGGDFSVIGDTVAARIAAYDAAGNHCTPIGTGIAGTVRSLLALPNGHLIAGGTFASAGGVSALNIARWNGTFWTGVGGGIAGSVHALLVLPNGDIVAAGQFVAAGGIAAANIARWDGIAWSALGSGTNGLVRALAVAPNGDVIAGGDFSLPAARIARWTNGAWQPLGSGLANEVRGVAALPNGDVLAAGNFPENVARWNGSVWSGVSPTSMFEFGQSLSWLPSGSLVLGTQGFAKAYVWNGASFQHLVSVTGGTLGPGGPTSVIHAVTNAANGHIVVAGDFRAS
ncbi:MAG TPA: hypothetical protein VFT55_15565, partial [Planctomycetota bacterium]|nr:hypothetical protein [Planctomycetota bacterium]